jgi:hypothetical protein
MAQEEPNTPEKQLLGLIEDTKAQGSGQKRTRPKFLHYLSVTALRGRISFLVEKLNLRQFAKVPPLDIKTLNIVLKICAGGLALYFVANLIISIASLSKIPELGLDISERAYAAPAHATSLLKKVSYYTDKALERDIFSFESLITTSEIEEVMPPEEALVSKLQEAMSTLRLVGIAWSDEPDAMIEDKGSGEVHFVRRGDLIDGKVKVEMIMRDRVLLSYEGEEAELR